MSKKEKPTFSDNKINEPALSYIRKNMPSGELPCQYSVEEMRAGVRESVKQFKEGKYYTDEEIDKIILL